MRLIHIFSLHDVHLQQCSESFKQNLNDQHTFTLLNNKIKLTYKFSISSVPIIRKNITRQIFRIGTVRYAEGL